MRRYTIGDELVRMRDELDRAFSNFFRTEPFWDSMPPLLEGRSESAGRHGALSNYREPAADLWESDKEIVVELELPGVDKKDIDVSVRDGLLEVRGQSKREERKETERMYRLERSYQGFYRQIALPQVVDKENAKAEYKDGILRISLLKQQVENQPEGKKLEVK